MFDFSNHYVGYYNDENILKQSSSGGIFSALAKIVLDKGGIVIGAAYNADLKRVEHICAESFEQLKPMRKSKYVWSEFKTSFEFIEKAIAENRYVLFTGVPCQAKAIRKKYGHYDKLYIADLFCYGVADAKFFNEYINTFCKDATKFDFRCQSDISKSNYTFRAFNDNNILYSDNYDDNVFTKLFIYSAILREPCLHCCLSTERHIYSDITMGDYTYDFNANGNVTVLHPSIFAINTSKGELLFEQASKDLCYYLLTKKQEICYYYRDRKNIRGRWGYNRDIKEKFLLDYEKYGFKKAAIMNAFSGELLLLDKAVEMSNNKSIALYGCGNIGIHFYKFIKNYYYDCINLKMFIVTDKNNCPKFIDDIPVYSIDEISEEVKNENISIIISVSDKFRSEVEKILQSYEINNYL